jgi:hypothetical protein
MALNIITLSIGHAVITTGSILGNRPVAAMMTLANGVIYALFALVFGKLWGLPGIAIATTLSTLVTTLPMGMRLLAPTIGPHFGRAIQMVVVPWLIRMLPLFSVAVMIGTVKFDRYSPTPWICAVLISVCYVWVMKPLYRDIEVGARISRAMAMVGLR